MKPRQMSESSQWHAGHAPVLAPPGKPCNISQCCGTVYCTACVALLWRQAATKRGQCLLSAAGHESCMLMCSPSSWKAAFSCCLRLSGALSLWMTVLMLSRFDKLASAVPSKLAALTKSTDTSAFTSSCSTASKAPNGIATPARVCIQSGSFPCMQGWQRLGLTE